MDQANEKKTEAIDALGEGEHVYSKSLLGNWNSVKACVSQSNHMVLSIVLNN